MKLAVATLTLFALAPLATVSAKEAEVRTATDHKWEANPAVAGAESSVLWGDPKTGAYAALRRVKAGTVLPRHTHSENQKVISIAGTIALDIEGIGAKSVGAGSYVFIPKGLAHSAVCEAGADCLYLEIQPGPADMKPAPAK